MEMKNSLEKYWQVKKSHLAESNATENLGQFLCGQRMYEEECCY